MEFPTLEEMVKELTEKTLDGYEYQGKTIRQWANILSEGSIAPVVRCKNCKYLMFSDGYGECDKALLGIVGPDDFCSRGERKEK